MSALALAAGCSVLAVLLWPRPEPSARLPRSSPDRTGIRSALGAIWWLAPALACMFILGAHAALAAVFVVRTGLSSLRRRRNRLAEAAGGAGIARLTEALCGELSSGAAPIDALDTAARDTTGDFRTSAVAWATRVKIGTGRTDAITDAPRSVTRAFQGLSAAWRLSEHHGVPLSDLADGLREDAVGRHAHRSSVSASLAGPRATMMILAALPLLGIGMGQALGATPVSFLLSGGLGGWVLLVGTGLACAGVLWSQQILAKAEGIS